MKFLFLFLSFLAIPLYAEDPDTFKAAKEITLDKPENHFLTSFECVSKVNPLTGEYSEEEIDLVVAGSQPISLRRFYNHMAPADPRYARWRYNPECFLAANFEWEGEQFAAVGDYDGSIVPLSRDSSSFRLDPAKNFFSSFSICHPLTLKLDYIKKAAPKDKHVFQFLGKVTDGSGRVRTFGSPAHRWHRDKHIHEKKRGPLNLWGSDSKILIRPSFWTPYHLPIDEERLPNGNILKYEYIPWSDTYGVPHPVLLSSITAYNSDKTKVLGFIHLHYEMKKGYVKTITAVGSDERKAVFTHEIRKVQSENKEWKEKEIFDAVLKYVATPQKPNQGYEYIWENRRDYFKRPFMTWASTGSFFLSTEYHDKKVALQKAPIGPNGESIPIFRYKYQDHSTSVFDADDHETVYRFDDHKRIAAIEKYQSGTLYRKELFNWDKETGNLLTKKIADASGIVLKIEEYQYDKNHNPILEKIGDRIISRTFSDDGFNLKLTESDRPGKVIRYSYLPQTNLLASQLVYEESKIRSRTFHFYDDCAICTKTIVDDGSTDDPYDLKDVTNRKITQITPKQTLPCFGLPEIVEEKTINPQGHEILLHKTVYTYTPFGKVSKEAHYDSNNKSRYTLVNTYDERERLSSQTDPLGSITTFTYDENNNLTSTSGPKPDQYREIAYDKANRPIQIADWQKDTILLTEKKYDKMGRLIEQTDPCGNKTLFQFDDLGRLIATLHPDAAVERKEYDIFGNITKEIDGEGYETLKTYNCFGQVLDISYPDGSKEHFTYNPTGTVASHRDKNGALWHYTYDLFDHLIKKEGPKTITFTWTPFQKLSETNGAITTTYTYDFAGRKIGEQKGPRTIRYLYDALGRIERTQEGNLDLIEEHDALDQLIEMKKEAPLQFQEAYTYDENGNRTQVINSQGITETLYNTDDKPISIRDPLGTITRFLYSYKDVFTKTTIHPNGVQTVEIYDSRDRLSKCFKHRDNHILQQFENLYNKNGNKVATIHTDPNKTITHRWEYGPMGQLERFIEANERETHYFYDDKGRLKTIVKPDGRYLSHEYDNLGRLTRFSSKEFDYHYTYDVNDRVTTVYDCIAKITTERVYDPLGNILEERLATGLTLQNTYDTLGRRIALTLPDISEITYTYKGHYLYQVGRKANGLDHTHTYSKRNLEGQILQTDVPETIERDKLGRYISYTSPYYTASHYKYDNHGNLLHYENTFGEYAFSYDDLDQLTSENDHTYLFDSLYNRLEKDDLPTTTDNFCQVISDSEKTYEYDARGNLISVGDTKYAYDTLGRLTSVENAAQRIEYTYDPFNRRLSKTVFSKGKKVSTRYLWDGENEIGSVDEKNKIQELRILGEGLGAEIGSAVLYELKGKTYIPIHDHRGCVVALANSKETYQYTAFGEELTQNTLSPWRFASKRVDPETNLVFFGRRYYSPTLGRFITQDPEGFTDGPNLYAYLKNCPLSDFDEYGLYGMIAGGFYNHLDFPWRSYGFARAACDSIKGIFTSLAPYNDPMGLNVGWNDRHITPLRFDKSVPFWSYLAPETYSLKNLSPASSLEERKFQQGRAAFEWGMYLAPLFGTASKIASFGNFARAGKIAEEIASLGGAGKVADFTSINGKELFNFGVKSAEHMANPNRFVPIHLLKETIENTKGVVDPMGSRALMYYNEIWKNGQKYNLEILYDKSTNSIWHFQYDRKPRGNMPKIDKK